MSNRIKASILRLKESSTLLINEKSKDLISQGKKVYQFGFGQSPFPVPEKIVNALKENAHKKEIWELAMHTSPQIKNSSGELLVASASADQTIKFWNLTQS